MSSRVFVAMKRTEGAYRRGYLYCLPETFAGELISSGAAELSDDEPQYVKNLLGQLDDGAGKPCLFLPFCGEFGHELLSHVRIVHFHKASEKIVCCRPGHEVLYPSATYFVTDWTDPLEDVERIGTIRDRVLDWPELVARFPRHYPTRGGSHLTMDQEMWPVEPTERIQFAPKKRGLKTDLVFGVRQRELSPHRNWPFWAEMAEAANKAELSFAVVGARGTSFDLPGQTVHSGDLDTDAAIELMQNCKLYVGTDSGASHLAAAVGATMLLVERGYTNGFRDFVALMELMNSKPIEIVPGTWENPAPIARRMIERIRDAA